MDKLLANWYSYIFDCLYTQTSTYNMLTIYSNAILDALGPDGSMHAIYMFIRTIGFGILTVYFIIALGTRAESREFTPSVVFKTLLEYFVGYILALYSFDIVKNLFIFGDWMANSINEGMLQNAGSLDGLAETFAASVANLSFDTKIIYILKGLIPYVVCVASNIIIIYAVMTRVLRICVNATLSPIAVANFFEGTRRSDAMRFLKRTFAMCLQCSTIMIITACAANLTGYIESDSQYSSSFDSNNEYSNSAVATAKNEMLDSYEINNKAVKKYLQKEYYKFGEIGQGSDAYEAYTKLYSNYNKVKKDNESTYQSYEKKLGISLFKRSDDNKHYIYQNGYAVLNDKYAIFSESTTEDFLNALLGGNNYWIFILLLVVRMGLIKKSMSLCNVIAGV